MGLFKLGDPDKKKALKHIVQSRINGEFPAMGPISTVNVSHWIPRENDTDSSVTRLV